MSAPLLTLARIDVQSSFAKHINLFFCIKQGTLEREMYVEFFCKREMLTFVGTMARMFPFLNLGLFCGEYEEYRALCRKYAKV